MSYLSVHFIWYNYCSFNEILFHAVKGNILALLFHAVCKTTVIPPFASCVISSNFNRSATPPAAAELHPTSSFSSVSLEQTLVQSWLNPVFISL